ncbi:hypothetical protein [Streptomyces sp. NRRL WC-3618]|uniref:hypothetical protein n=1 Tax=Streptomyces sp. NRRL WC-3618 TaxID=1519490 RepID=UPI000A4C683B|nr:hypothetical protein [Streptomyces sp. NRRL WC-3618]
MQSIQQRERPPVRTAVLTAVTVMALLLGACTGESHSDDSGATVGAEGGEVSGKAGGQDVTVTVPREGARNGTEVEFQERPKVDTGLTDKHLGVAGLGAPVEISTTRGALTQGRVSLSYDSGKLPRGVTAKQIGIMVFDSDLGAWFPLLDAEADPRTHRVTGTAPHFSLFRTFFVEPGEKLLHMAGREIKLTVDAGTSVMGYFQKLITASAVAIVKDLFAVPPALNCDKPSATVVAEASTAVGDNSFSACADGDGKEVTLNMVNGVAYPIRLDRLPSGVTITGRDVLLGSGDSITVIRNVIWMTQGQKVIAGAKAGSVTVNEKMTTARLHGHMDGSAVAVDVLLGTLLAFMPALSADKKWIEGIAQKAVNSPSVKDGGAGLARATRMTVDDASTSRKVEGQPDVVSQFATLMGAGDCLLDSKDALSENGSAKERFESAVKAAQTCAKLALGQFKATEVIPALLDSLKLVPEIVQAQIAGISNVLTGGKHKLTSVFVDLSRFDSRATLKGNYQGTWQAHRRKIIIDEDGSGRYNWFPFLNYDDPSSDPPCVTAEPRGCEVRFRLTVTPAGATAEVTVSNDLEEWPIGHKVNVSSNAEAGTITFDTETNVDHGGGGSNEFCGPRATRYCGA